MRGDKGTDFAADTADVNVHGTGAAAVLETPYAMQQDLSTIRAIGVRGQKAQQRILHEREVDGLAIERHLVGGKVDSEVIHGEHLIDRNGLALAQKLA